MLPIVVVASILLSLGIVLLASMLISIVVFKNRKKEEERVNRGVVLSEGRSSNGLRSIDFTSMVPSGYIESLDRQLLLAGRPESWSLTRILVAKPVLAVVAFFVALIWISSDPQPIRVVLGLALIGLAFFVPDLLIRSRASERQKQISMELPDTLDQMTIAVEAGLGFDSAMAKAGANGQGPLAEELVRTMQDMSLGLIRKDAYAALGERSTSQDLRRFTRAIIQADTYGIAVANVLRIQAAEMRLKRRQRAEERAMKVPVMVVFPLTLCILPVLFIVLLTPAIINIIDAFS